MKKITLTFILLLIACIVSLSQRRLQIVSDEMDDPFDAVVVENYTYVAQANGTTLRRYDGTFSSIPYPLDDDGLPLKYQVSTLGTNALLSYNARLYIVLRNEMFEPQFYVYDDTFHRIPIDLVSNVVIYRGGIYMLGRRSGTAAVKLFSYDGFSLVEMSSMLSGVSAEDNDLFVGGEYLYIQGRPDPAGPLSVIQYTGTYFRTLTGFPNTFIKDVVGVSGTNDAYINFSDNDVYFVDGTTVANCFDAPVDAPIGNMVLSGEVLYFQSRLSVEGTLKLNRCYRGICSEILIPEGNLVRGGPRNVIYRDELYLPLELGGTYYIYRYDGTSFHRFFEFPVAPGPPTPALSVREGKLLIMPRPTDSRTVYEYDGTGFTSIIPPASGRDYRVYKSYESTFCYHTWSVIYRDPSLPGSHSRWQLAIEVPDSTCITPPPAGPVSIIPDRLREYDHFWGGVYSPERGWCWNEIILDWLPPLCTQPPCGDRPEEIQTTLVDMKGQLAYSKTFDKPFSTKFPVDDKPYTLSVSVGKDDKFDPVLRFDNDLVNKGIENIAFDMFPKEDYFFFTVDTKKQQQVPISLTLRDTKGEALWQENFTAPMDKLVRAFVDKPGAYLQVSLQQQTSGVTYYPNPFKENLVIEVADGTDPVSISLTDLNGKIMFQSKILEPGKHAINVGAQKSGLYILTIVEGKLTRKELVQVSQ